MPDKLEAEVARMFDEVADRYDRMNTLMTFGQERRWRREVAVALVLLLREDLVRLIDSDGALGGVDQRVLRCRWLARGRHVVVFLFAAVQEARFSLDGEKRGD